MKKLVTICAAAFLLMTACDRYPSHSLIVNSTDALVVAAIRAWQGGRNE